MKQCKKCQNPLTGKQRNFCCNACKCSFYHPPKIVQERLCTTCNKSFLPKIEHPRYHYCSDKCKSIHIKSKEQYKQNRRIYNKQHRENNLLLYKERDSAYYNKNKQKFYANNAKRRAISKQATPAWADMNDIRDVYKEAQYWGYHVDHIVPLRGKNVCGLHVWDNLQLLPAHQNLRKGNYHSIHD